MTKTIFLGFFIFSFSLLSSQSFFKVIGNDMADEFRQLAVLSDGSILATGVTRSHHISKTDLLLVKLNASGNILWTKVYRSNSWAMDVMFGQSVKTTNDGSIYLTGELSTLSGSSAFLMKLDSHGDLQWVKEVISAGSEGYDIVILDGHIYLAGNIFDKNMMGMLCKFDTNGNLIWARMYSHMDDEDVYTDFRTITATADQLLAIGGNVVTANGPNYLTLKADTSGHVVWSKFIASDGVFETAHAVTSDELGNIYTAGQLDLFDNGAVIVKYNSNGNREYLHRIVSGPNSSVSAVTSISSENGRITGTLSVLDFDDPHPWAPENTYIIEIGSTGALAWSKKLLLPYSDKPQFIVTTTDGYIIGGWTASANGVNGYIRKSTGGINPSCKEEAKVLTLSDLNSIFPDVGASLEAISITVNLSTPSISMVTVQNSMDSFICNLTFGMVPFHSGFASIEIFPNPATDQIMISGKFNEIGATVLIYNVNGQLIRKLPLRSRIETGDLPPGLYAIILEDSEGNWHRGKFVKME